MPQWDRGHQPPDDWTEEENGYHMVLICLPNSHKWRTTLISAIWEMTSARFYKWENGRAMEAKAIAEGVLNSMTFDCNNNLDRIATALESINEKTIERLTWQDVLDDLETTLGIGNIFYETIKWFMDLFPTIALKADGTQLVMALWRYFTWSRPILDLGNSVVRAMWAIVVALGGSELIGRTLTGWQELSLWFLDWIKGDTEIKDIVEDVPQSGIPDSEGGTGGDDPDNNPALRVINNVFVENEAMAVNNNQEVTVNCGSGVDGGLPGCGSGTSTGFIPDQTPSGTIFDEGSFSTDTSDADYFPSSFDSKADWQAYKCKAANAMAYNLIESIYQFFDVAHKEHPTQTHSLVVQSVYQAIYLSDWMFGYGWLYSTSFYSALVQWEAENVADYIYQAPDLSVFDIFTDIRNQIIDDRENFVCEIYNSQSGDEVKNNILQKITEYLGTLSYDPTIEGWAYQIIEDMLSDYWCNIPFKKYDNVDGFSDGGAIDCAICSEYLYPTGTCSDDASGEQNPDNGDGEPSAEVAGPYQYNSWTCDISSPVLIGPDTTLGFNADIFGDGQINLYLYATIDGTEYPIENWDFQHSGSSGWYDKAIGLYDGQYLEEVRIRGVDRGIGPDPSFWLNGIRVKAWGTPS